MNVHKFGGTSVGSAERILQAAELVRASGPGTLAVVSALAGVTDRLGRLVACHRDGDEEGLRTTLDELRTRHLRASEAVGDHSGEHRDLTGRVEAVFERLESVLRSPRAATGVADPLLLARLNDEITAAGEDLSAEILAGTLRARGVRAFVVDARSVMRTDAAFGHAAPVEGVVDRLVAAHVTPRLEAGDTLVVQGFVGATVNGVTTTLGRGGSDFTAAVLGAALGVPEVSIWTDVDGILSADPRSVAAPRLLDEIGFEEAVELAYFGARVIHPKAAQWAVHRGVALRIRNSFRPDGYGTVIRWDRRGSAEVAAVAYKPDVILIQVRSHPTSLPYGFLARVFDVLARHRLPVDLVATSHSSTAFTIDEDEEVGEIGVELGEFAEVEVVRDLATVTVVGHGMMDEPGVDARVFAAVGSTPVHLISQASDVSLSFVVSAAEAPGVVQRIHERLIAPRGVEVRT